MQEPGPKSHAVDLRFNENAGDEEVYDDSDGLDSGSDEISVDEEVTWIEWFCGLKGHEYLVEVDEDYIQDEFNLTGLSSEIDRYDDAISLILDDIEDTDVSEASMNTLENSAFKLYGLIHARYIVTTRGMNAVVDKLKCEMFGTCPNIQCEHQGVLPFGLSDKPSVALTKVYCPRCCELYTPRVPRLSSLDGSFFGPSFAPMCFMIHESLCQPAKSESPRKYYSPSVHGFRVHASLRSILKAERQTEETVTNEEWGRKQYWEPGPQTSSRVSANPNYGSQA